MNPTKRFLCLCITTLALFSHGCADIKIGPLLSGRNEEPVDKTENSYAKKLELSDLKADKTTEGDKINAKISGRIKNGGRKTVSYAKINVKFLDARGDVVDNDKEKIVNDNTLAPGENHRFKFSVKKVASEWAGKIRADFVKVKVLNK